jgi:hypothetical protein
MLKRRVELHFLGWVALLAVALLAVRFGAASLPSAPAVMPMEHLRIDPTATQTLRELNRLGILRLAPQPAVENLLTYQRRTGRSLAQILREPFWVATLGLSSTNFKATWYAANPFDMLPKDLQVAIRETKEPFRSRSELEKWCANLKAPDHWKTALNFALVETTASNLWRAARGLRPFTKNGQYLEPIVVEKGGGVYDVREGHIATDPAVIPTGTTVLMLVRVGGKDRLLRVKATDIGSAIRGEHVDLPIQIRPKPSATLTAPIRFPKEYIRNSSVVIFLPAKSASVKPSPAKTKASPDRKASAARPSRLPS